MCQNDKQGDVISSRKGHVSQLWLQHQGCMIWAISPSKVGKNTETQDTEKNPETKLGYLLSQQQCSNSAKVHQVFSQLQNGEIASWCSEMLCDFCEPERPY